MIIPKTTRVHLPRRIDQAFIAGYIKPMFSSQRAAFSLLSLFAILMLSGTTALVQSGDYFPPPDSQGGWRTLTNTADIRRLAGLDLPKLDQAFDFTQRCSQNGGLLVVRHAYLVFEKYFGRAHRNAN